MKLQRVMSKALKSGHWPMPAIHCSLHNKLITKLATGLTCQWNQKNIFWECISLGETATTFKEHKCRLGGQRTTSIPLLELRQKVKLLQQKPTLQEQISDTVQKNGTVDS
eukprot:10139482-Karenia_brevis.AAC.1